MTERDIFIGALQRDDPDARRVYLAQACGSDAALRGRVDELLGVHGRAASFLESPAIGPAVTADLPAADRPGTAIGPYKLIEPIGEGGFGVVFLAEQTEPVRRKVALKVLKPGMDSRQVVARFEAERQALALMDHPNIARVFDGGMTEAGRPYFVMELVKGVPITEFCDQNQLPPRDRLNLFVQVCQAVQHAHQKAVIHRDLKPSNVLVSRHDTTAVVKVIDFGVAKALGQGLTDKTLVTGLAQMVGTPLYMAPEQAGMSDLDADTRSDIYSLGVLLYELLTGTTPLDKDRFRAAGYDEIRRILREEDPPRPSTRISTLGLAATTVSANRGLEPVRLSRLVRGELDWIVMKALEKDRSRRYDTAAALAADVERYLADEPVLACPPSAAYRFRKFARRNKRGLLTASVIALAVVLTAAASGVLIWQANRDLHQALGRERDTLERERRNSYFQRIALADREWPSNQSRMEELLEECPPDLRGWEWHYLKRLRYRAPLSLRHASCVHGVAFGRDGELLATATETGFIHLWDAVTGQERHKWPAHGETASNADKTVTTVAFSPDGRLLASGGYDGMVRVWDLKVLAGEARRPKPVLELEHIPRVWTVAFSSDGRRLAVAAGRAGGDRDKGEVKVWDLNSPQQPVLQLGGFTTRVSGVGFSPDGRSLVTASGESVQLWDAQTGRQLLGSCRDPAGNLQGVTFSPNGRAVAAVGGMIAVHPDREVKVWDAQTGEEVFGLQGHVGGLKAVAFSPDGGRLASAGLDQTVKLWDAATGQEVLTLRGHLDEIFCLAFSRDGRRLATGSLDRTVRVWDATPVDPAPGTESRTFPGHQGAVTDVAFHPNDGRTLASAGTDGTVRFWDYKTGKHLDKRDAVPSPLWLRIAYSPDGRHLAVASAVRDRKIRVLDVATGQLSNPIDAQGPVFCLAFGPAGRHLAAAGSDATVWVWKAATGKSGLPLKDHDSPVFGLAFSPDGRHLATGSGDSTVRVWDWAAGRELRVLEPGHAGRVVSVAFSPDRGLLASGGWDRTVKVWDTRTWELRHDLHDPTGAVQCVAFAPRGRIVWGSTDSTVKVWDGPGTETQVLRGHTSWVQAVAISPDGKWIASASLDGTVKVWPASVPEAPAPEAGEPGK